MERDKHLLLSDVGRENKFFNIRTKIKNPNLGDEVAWGEAQPLFEFCVDGYPEKYLPHLKLFQKVFNWRRNAFLRKLPSADASKKVQELFDTLDPDNRDGLLDLMVCIRDFFDIPAPSHRLRSS